MKHIILAVSYRAELLEKEMKAQEERVRCCGDCGSCIKIAQSGQEMGEGRMELGVRGEWAGDG